MEIERTLTTGVNTTKRAKAHRYWLAVLALTIANTIVLGATSAVAGFTITPFSGPSSELVILNILALTILFWPTAAFTIRRLFERRTLCFLGAAIHMLGVFLLMETYFGKPSGLLSGSTMAQSLPTLIALGLTAWITVEWQTRRNAPAPQRS